MNTEYQAIYRSAITLLAPEYLLLLPAVLLIALLGWCFQKRRGEIRSLLGLHFTADLPLLIVLPALCILLLALALIRPSIGSYTVTLPQKTPSLFLAVDVSRSMRAQDVPPDRMTMVRRKLLDLVDEIQRSGFAPRVGIVLFSGGGVMYCPLTSDYGVLRLYIRELSPSLLSSHGSSIDAALHTVARTAHEIGIERASVAIFSDGEFSEFSESSDIPFSITTFGVGSSDGAPIPLRNGVFQKDSSGNTVVSKLNEENLQLLAKLGNGTYHRLKVGGSEITQFVRALEERATSAEESVVREISQQIEIFHYFLWGLLCVLGILALIPLRAGILGLLLATCLLSFPQRSSADMEPLADGKALFAKGDFDSAKERFEAALRRDPNNAEAAFGLGTTLYRLGKYREAEQLLDELSKRSALGREVFRSLYNAGNSALQAKDFQKAIEHYERALQLLPEDEKTKHNLEIAKHMLEEQKQQQQPEQQPEDGQEQQPEQPQGSEEDQESGQEQDQAQQDQEQKEEQQQSGDQDQGQDKQGEQQAQGDQQREESKEQEHGEEQDGEKEQQEPAKERDGSGKEGDDNGQEQREGDQRAAAEGNQKELTVAEREAAMKWLRSLPESPLLLPEYETEQVPPGGQLW